MGLILANINGGPPGFSNIKVGNGGGMGVGASAPSGGGGAATRTPHTHWRVRNGYNREDVMVVAGIEFRTSPGGANVATGGTPIASDNAGISSRAFDGDPETFWNGSNGAPYNYVTAPDWIGYQFATAVDIQEVQLTARNSSLYAPLQTTMWGYIESSDNGSSWTTEATFATSVYGAGESKLLPVVGNATWLTRGKTVFKLELYNSNDYIRACEIEFRSSIGVSNPGLGGFISPSRLQGDQKLWHANDGDTNTEVVFSGDTFYPNAYDPKVLIHWFNTAPTIRQISYRNNLTGGCCPSQAPTQITLKSSTDQGVTYVTEETWSGITWSTSGETKTFNLTNPIIP